MKCRTALYGIQWSSAPIFNVLHVICAPGPGNRLINSGKYSLVNKDNKSTQHMHNKARIFSRKDINNAGGKNIHD
jgi:hypothetical protein